MCDTRDNLVAMLAEEYNEHRRVTGIVGGDKLLLEIFVSPVGSWTAMFTEPNGLSCLQAAGKNWDDNPLPESEKPL